MFKDQQTIRDKFLARSKKFRSIRFEKGQVILSEGETGDTLFILRSGTVEIILPTTDDRHIVLSQIGPGEMFGVMALLEDEVRSASVMATSAGAATVITRHQLLELFREDPEILLWLTVDLSRRLRATNHLVRMLLEPNSVNRLARWLSIRSAAYRSDAGDQRGGLHIHLPNHRIIADETSLSRETVSRSLRRLVKDGILTATRGKSVLNLDKLEALTKKKCSKNEKND